MDWSALSRLNPEEGATQLTEFMNRISELIEQRPEIEPKLVELLERSLRSEIDTETYTSIWHAITALIGIGEDAPRLFTWLSVPEQQERLDALTARCKPGLARLLRNLFALYGESLQVAYRRWREYPDNWEAMHRQVYVDQERNQNRIDIKIVKYNQESLDLTLDARSLLLMVSRLMNSLTLAASGPFTDAELSELRGQSEAFWGAIDSSGRDQPAAVAEQASPLN